MKITHNGKTLEIPGAMTVSELLRSLNVPRESVIAVKSGKKGGKILPENEPLEENDEIELLRVFSGG